MENNGNMNEKRTPEPTVKKEEKHKTGRKKRYRIYIILCIAALICLTPFVISEHVQAVGEKYFLTQKEAENFDADCIIVLGAGVYGTTLSSMLKDRVDSAVDVFQNGGSKKLLLSGDNSRQDYDEVTAMKLYILGKTDISDDAIYLDHAGFSTYETMYRARDIFCAKRVIIITQKYHLYRAVYDARRLGLDAYGVCSEEPYTYAGEFWRETREILARCKDFAWCIFQPKPTFLGDKIPITEEQVNLP